MMISRNAGRVKQSWGDALLPRLLPLLFGIPCFHILTSVFVFSDRPVMAALAQTISLSTRNTNPEVGSESGPSPAPALPPISRRKQAAVLSSAFVTIALTIGYNQCFGVFQEFYLSSTQDVLVPAPALQASPPTALLAFVGTLCYGLTWAGGIFVNPVISRIESRRGATSTGVARLGRRRILRRLTLRMITVSGVFIMSAGFTLASFSTSVWQLLLTQGLLCPSYTSRFLPRRLNISQVIEPRLWVL